MLIINRCPDDVIAIGDDITVSVIEVSGNQIRIGVDAPKEVSILREELLYDDEDGVGGS